MAEDKTEQQKKDEQLQKEAREKSEAQTKLVDEIVEKIHGRLQDVGVTGLQEIVRQVAAKVAGIQVIAAGAVHGPTMKEVEELQKPGVLPIIAKPMADGTPVANIAQAPKPGDKPEAPKENVPVGLKQPAKPTK